LAAIVFGVNLIKTKRIKWLIIIVISSVFLILTLFGFNALEGNPVDILIELSQTNIPFLPQLHISMENAIIRYIICYLIYFCGTLLYWYSVYHLAKKIVNIKTGNFPPTY
jgi:4-hydroxybenzoate polyprenyltransferase